MYAQQNCQRARWGAPDGTSPSPTIPRPATAKGVRVPVGVSGSASLAGWKLLAGFADDAGCPQFFHGCIVKAEVGA